MMKENPAKVLLKLIRVLYFTIQRDITAIFVFLQLLIKLKLAQFRNDTIVTCFSRNLKSHPGKVAFIQDDKQWTFEEVDKFSNQVANYLTEEGIKAGDEVAIFMTSRAELPIIMLATAKIGAISALINENIRLDALVHAVTCVNSKCLIFDPESASVVIEVQEELSREGNLKLYSLGEINKQGLKVPNLEKESRNQPAERLKKAHRGNFTDKLCYIYTSGTTGLPKAAILRHSRYLLLCVGKSAFTGIRADDIVYNPMPLYHSMGNVFGCGCAFVDGVTVVLKKKFSASQFWNDCIKYNCTISLYIGEALRYLLNQPPKPTDRSHKVRLFTGVGLRKQLWKQFVERFQIKHIVEFYGATESNMGLVNLDSREGSCGFLPALLPNFIIKLVFPVTLIKVNEEGEPIRDKEGHCIMCGPGEHGMIVGKIKSDNVISRFDGYSNQKETEKKILRNVFSSGDAYFASGDILYMDEFGYLYFKDRTGDTFRWKGENVSTNEVEGLVMKACGVKDCVCYGVNIPNNEGKAGMITVTSDEPIDIEQFYQKIKEVLPKYAIPLFVRIEETVELTGTFKYSKNKLRKEGFDINTIQSDVFYLDTKARKYRKLDQNTHKAIMEGEFPF